MAFNSTFKSETPASGMSHIAAPRIMVGRFARPEHVVALLLILVPLTAFRSLTRCGFINLDDDVYVTANSWVQGGITIEGVGSAFWTFHAAWLMVAACYSAK